MSFYDNLNQSPWKGVIAEVGIGLEFSSRLLRVPGASNTVLQVVCDYAGLDRKHDVRAVSLENAASMALKALEKAKSNLSEYEPAEHRFGLAITGAHYNDKPSHAYVYLATPQWDAYMHFTIAQGCNREQAGCIVNDRIIWFLTGCFLGRKPWMQHIEDISDSLETHNIDILYAPGVSDVERLSMLRPNNPLVYHDGHFQRVTDYVRKYKTIYSGAFNPPTRVHLEIEDCLFEITQTHRYKQAASIEDLLHRIRMLNAEGRPVLLTQLSLFMQKHDLLDAHGASQFTFVMGADAWNIFIADHQCPPDNRNPSETWLRDRLFQASFLVRPRAGHKIEHNPVSRQLPMVVGCERTSGDCSATDVRKADVPHEHPNLTPNVARYIASHGLYRR